MPKESNMTAFEFMKKLDGPLFETEGTVDNFKYGDKDKEVKRVATCLTATPEVIKAAHEWGADLIVTHEPTFYEHTDNIVPCEIVDLKLRLLEECAIPLCRYHDHMHFCKDYDLISEAFLRTLKWDGDYDGNMGFELKEPKTPLEIAGEVQDALGLKHVRIIGARNGKVTKIGLFLGHRGEEAWGDFKRNRSYELALGGEWCEWHDGEMIRDAAQFGRQLTAIMLGHAGSERIGMKILADDINRDFADDAIEAKYFECGELYTYLD